LTLVLSDVTSVEPTCEEDMGETLLLEIFPVSHPIKENSRQVIKIKGLHFFIFILQCQLL